MDLASARFAAAAVALGLALASGSPATRPAIAAARHLTDLMFCGERQHIVVASGQQRYIIKNDNYGGTAECLVNTGDGPDFRVAYSAAASKTNAVMAYPEIFTGCSWGICSPSTRLPLLLSKAGQPEATWSTSQHASGRWDAAFDIWFNRTPITTGQATGAEMMIWLNARNYRVPRHTRKVWIDGQRWYLQRWIAHHDGARWHYIQFRRVTPTWTVRRLKIMPFARRAERLRWIKPQWWLLNIETGFEIWRGGTGLATRGFWARA